MITARHISGTRKTFSDPDSIIRFMRKEPNPEMWTVNIDGFHATGLEVSKHGKLSTSYRTKMITPRHGSSETKAMLTALLKHKKQLLELITNNR